VSGSVIGVEQIAYAKNASTRQVNMTISLAFLAPDLVRSRNGIFVSQNPRFPSRGTVLCPVKSRCQGVADEMRGLGRLDGGGSSQIRTGLSLFFPVISELTGKIPRFSGVGPLKEAIMHIDSVG
jgi:hypothetical protein